MNVPCRHPGPACSQDRMNQLLAEPPFPLARRLAAAVSLVALGVLWAPALPVSPMLVLAGEPGVLHLRHHSCESCSKWCQHVHTQGCTPLGLEALVNFGEYACHGQFSCSTLC
jgi:hypothetical protein